MEPHGSNGSRAEAERWLVIAEKLLAGRDLVGSRTFAIRARESDPSLDAADQILAVTDTLIAGEKRINNQHDWYAILQLPQQTCDLGLIATHYRQLAILLNPHRNHLPFADEAFKLVYDAWSVLLNPSEKSIYDNELTLFSKFGPAAINRVQEHHEHHHQHDEQQQQKRQPQPQQQQQQQQPQQPQPQPQPQQQQQQEPQQQPQPQQQRQQQPQPPQPPPPRQQQQHRPPPPPEQRAMPPPKQQLPQQQQQEEEQLEEHDSEQSPNHDSPNKESIVSEERESHQDQDENPTFWTACPYCYNMYEYPRAYKDCSLRCLNCQRAFHAAKIPEPSPIVEGKEAYFCCWGFFPLGVSMSNLEKNKGGVPNWAPFSPMFTCPQFMDKMNVGKKRKGNFRKSSGPWVYIDDDEALLEVSEPSDDSDDEWGSTKKKKKSKKMKRKGSMGKRVKKLKGVKSKKVKRADGEDIQGGPVMQEVKGAPHVPNAETSRKVVANSAKKLTGKVPKERGKLDLNVEFSNEVEEPAPGMSERIKTGNGEEDGIEGIGFFEGLDEFLSSLPILNVVGADKVKAT
ncbi:hypothetical protein U1Q18_048376 [Sarracenia purpurea var. burkii]